MKPAKDWNEDDVWALPLDENDTFERKGARLLDLTSGADVSKVLDELSKQLSAFSNTGGGQIICGVTDKGDADNGGVTRTVKGNTKAWLEDVIPILTEFEIVGCNVKEIQPNQSGSKLASDKSIYIVDVPDSDRAPHQAKRDLKYYVRLGGKSQPAPHRLIEYIRNRQKHPSIDVDEFKLEVLQLPQYHTTSPPQPYSGVVNTRLHLRLRNSGKLMARNVCIHFAVAPGTSWTNTDTSLLQRGLEGFFEVTDPLYPGMEFPFSIGMGLTAYVYTPNQYPPYGAWRIGGKELPAVKLSWRLFADNAPAKQGEISLQQELKFIGAVGEAVDRYPFAGALRDGFPTLF